MIDRLQNQLLYLNDKIENISNIPILKRQHTRSASKSQNAPVENKSNKRKSEDLDLTLPIPSKKQSTNSPLESSLSSDSSNQCSATPPTLHVNPSQLPAPPIPPELNPNSSEQSAASTSNLDQLSVSSIQPASTLTPLEQPPASTITLLPSDQSTNSTSNPVQLPVSSTKPSSTSPTAASNIPPANPFRSLLPH
ncbi:mucin-7-like [Episyrphus balteatus]|uniref:mucin-7-like n=1 Tax=Episyrphus balteatus TaxID=286459 RepID=UPI002484EC1B|nr:mucin-7-like [Episyrphus balteatus]